MVGVENIEPVCSPGRLTEGLLLPEKKKGTICQGERTESLYVHLVD